MTTHQVSAVIRATDIATIESFISEHANVTIYVPQDGESTWFSGDESLIAMIEECPVDDMSGQIQHIMYGERSTRSRSGEIASDGIVWGNFAPAL